MKQSTWVLVADEAIARILAWPESGDALEPVEELTDPDAHAREGDLRRDATGRRAGTGNGALLTGGNATTSAGDSDRHLEAEAFAKRVAAHLATALQQKRFDVLHVVAAPRFLGLLRKALNTEVTRRIERELDKDLIHMDNADITARLFPEGQPAGTRA